jgi:amidase
MIEQDAVVVSEALKTKQISAVEVMQETLARIAQVNGAVNAIVSLREQNALLEDAERADASPRKGWLHGIPIAIKDLVDVAGLPNSKGSLLFKDVISPKDDIMVARLRAAGAIVIGKTNTPEFGLGSHTYNPVHGVTSNPYDLTKTCGGSSGGAAVALATGMVCVADGSDMMGSLRNPPAWNNVYGMRPSYGVVPSEAQGDTFMDHLHTNGPMARSPQDLAALLDTMAGLDPRQPHGLVIDPTLPLLTKGKKTPARIGWLGDWGGTLPFEAGIMSETESALGQMTRMGWRVEEASAPYAMDPIWQSWIDLRSFAHGANRVATYDDPSKRRMLNTAMRWEVERYKAMSAADVHVAATIQSDWYRVAHTLFDHYDALVMPSTQVWPFDKTITYPTRIGETEMDTYHRWMQVTVPAGLIGLPVVNLPIGFGVSGLPIGVQLIGARGTDAKILQLAQEWHEATMWPYKRPAMR